MNIRLTIGNVGGALVAAAGFLSAHDDLIPARYSAPIMGVASLILFFSHSVKPSDTTLDAVPSTDKTTVGPVTLQATGPLKTS